jgi:hypothetical protein
MDGVSRVAVTEIVLNEAPAVAIVGQDEPAGVSQRGRMYARMAGALGWQSWSLV